MYECCSFQRLLFKFFPATVVNWIEGSCNILEMLPVIEIQLPAQDPSSGGNVPAFLAKLWKMVNNPDTGEIKLTSDIQCPCPKLRQLDRLGRRRQHLHHQEPGRVHQDHAALLLQALQHGLIRQTAQHVWLQEVQQCRVWRTQGECVDMLINHYLTKAIFSGREWGAGVWSQLLFKGPGSSPGTHQEEN